MGIGNWLVGLGFKTEALAQQVGVRRGAVPLQWPAGQTGSVIYRLPRDPHQRASLFASSQTIVVNEGETAVVLEDGVSQGSLEPGRYVFEKARVVGSLDILWIRTGQQVLKWGVGNVPTIDGITISGNGMIYVKVMDGLAFNAEVIQGAITLAEADLQRNLMPRIQGVLRATISGQAAMDLHSKREEFESQVHQKLGQAMATLGMQIVGFEVIDINFPAEFKDAISRAAITAHTGNAELVQAKVDAERRLLEAQTEAQAQLTSGMAQAQVMAQLQAQGIDPMQMKALEAVSTLAENPGQGGGVHGDMPRVQLIGQVAGAAMTPQQPAQPATVQPQALLPDGTQAPGVQQPGVQQPGVQQPGIQQPAAPQPGMPGQFPPQAAPQQPATPQAQPGVAAAPAAGDNTAEIAKLQERLDGLLDKLLAGELTEETYNKLSSGLEARMAALKGG